MKKNKYQVLVVGSGPGGSITALNLLKAGYDVLLIDKGKHYEINEINDYSYSEMFSKYNEAGLTLAHGTPNINYVEGSCLGGGSEVNSGLYHRLPNKVFNEWRSTHNLEYDNDELNKIYSSIEKKINISYCDKKSISKASLKLVEGSKNLGLNCIEIPRWIKNVDGKLIKQSMTQTFLKEYVSLGGEFITDSEAIRISKSRLNSEVKIKHKNTYKYISVENIFLCSGSVNSPYLLLKSGIKRKIGNSLKLHPSFKFIAKFKHNVNDDKMGVPVHQVKHFEKISFGCSVSNKAYLGVGLLDTFNFDKIDLWRQMASYYSMISPEGSGKIYSFPFLKHPFVTYKLTKKDFEKIYFGIYKLGHLLLSAGAEELYPSVNSEFVIKNKKDLSNLSKINKSKLNLMTIHLFSSIKMGGIKNKYATNPYGKLWDHNNIYVNDGSMLCDSPTVNPQGTIMAFAQYNIQNFINENKRNQF